VNDATAWPEGSLDGSVLRPLWLDSSDRPAPRDTLTGNVEVDLLVVGGGFTGLWTALRAVERDPSTTVLLVDADRIAEHASGRNGGFCEASITHGEVNGRSRWPGEYDALHRIGLRNLDEIEATIHRYGIDCGFARGGMLEVATRPHEVAGLKPDEPVSSTPGQSGSSSTPRPTWPGATTPTAAPSSTPPDWHGAWQLRPRPSGCGSPSRVTPDRRILWGGYDAVYHFGRSVDARHDDRRKTFETLARNFAENFPQLRGIRFTHRWAGAIDTSTRFCAFFGTANRGRTAYATGFTGLGVGASRFAADVMLDLVEGRPTERTRLEMVRTKPLPFPPEPFAWIGIQLTRWSLARHDRSGKRNLWLRTLDRLGLGFDS
jgi:glycine/D-amino acid oxidase-like deaminating enzyme